MKDITRSINLCVLFLLICSVFVFSSCSKKGLKINISDSLKQVDVSKMTNASTPDSKPASASAIANDYLGESIKLVGIGHDSGGPYTVFFYTAVILTPPSPATKNEGLVKPTGKVANSSESEFWTPYIASSRPAVKDELKPGMVVFATGGKEKRSRDELAKTTKWAIFRVKDISTLYKGTVILTYNSTYGSSHWKNYEFHTDNIRVLVGELALNLVELPK
jgi:hypothetical protein